MSMANMSRPMEDVLDLYAEAPDPERPLVCFDETPVQLIGEVRQPVPAQPGRRERYDYEYRRNGTPISSSPSIHIEVGATSRSPTAAPPWTMPTACVNLSTSIIPAPPVSVSCRTICRSTSLGRCMRPSRPPRPDVSCAASNSTSPRSTPVGSTWSSRPPHRRPQKAPKPDRRMATAAKPIRARIKWMFTTDKARAKLGRGYPVTAKESTSL
ncbi:hypothetical protein ABIC10_001037 [Bradyrhizobium sp. S3.2.12]